MYMREMGSVELLTREGEVAIGITRAHLEEDAGKSLHEGLPGVTGIDLNRAGTPRGSRRCATSSASTTTTRRTPRSCSPRAPTSSLPRGSSC